MGIVIDLNETDANIAQVPIYLVKPDGTPQTDLTGITSTYRKPGGAGGELARALTVIGNGRFLMPLTTAGDLDTTGIGWVTITGATIISFVDWVEVKTKIPTNPLLTSDARVAHLDADVSSRASAAAVASVAAQVTAVQADTDDIQLRCTRIAGLLHENAMVDQVTYGSGALAVIFRVRIFADAAALAAAVPGHANGADGEIARYSGSCVDAGSGQFSSFKVQRTL
jgi:hypothetical protein